MTSVADQPTVTTTLTLVPLTHPVLHRVKRWTDQEALHHAVMGLFPDQLAGEPGVRRTTAGILFRRDAPANGPARLLVQHNTPLRAESLEDGELKQAGLDPFLETLAADRPVRFRVVLNAVRSQTLTKKRVAVTDPVDLMSWGQQRLEAAGLSRIEFSAQAATALGFTSNGPVWGAQFDGYACVGNADMLTDAVRQGIGRAKSYGCGLLSLAPAGH